MEIAQAEDSGLSTTHAEYIALADTANQAIWYWSFLSELSYEVLDLIPLYGDNKGTVNPALNLFTE